MGVGGEPSGPICITLRTPHPHPYCHHSQRTIPFLHCFACRACTGGGGRFGGVGGLWENPRGRCNNGGRGATQRTHLDHPSYSPWPSPSLLPALSGDHPVPTLFCACCACTRENSGGPCKNGGGPSGPICITLPTLLSHSPHWPGHPIPTLFCARHACKGGGGGGLWTNKMSRTYPPVSGAYSPVSAAYSPVSAAY